MFLKMGKYHYWKWDSDKSGVVKWNLYSPSPSTHHDPVTDPFDWMLVHHKATSNTDWTLFSSKHYSHFLFLDFFQKNILIFISFY